MLNAMIGAASGVIDTNNISETGFFHFSGRTDQNKRQEVLLSIDLGDNKGQGSSEKEGDHSDSNNAAISAVFDLAAKRSHKDILDILKQLKK